MIEQIEIKNFRGIKDMSLEGFSKINIFVGEANVGKTSILEALYLYLSEYPESITDVLKYRGIVSDEDCFQGFFYDYNLQKPIVLKEGKKELKIHSSNNIYTNVFVDNSRQEEQESIEIMLHDMPTKGIDEIFLKYLNNKLLKEIKVSKKQANPFQMQFNNEIIRNKGWKPIKQAEFICRDTAYHKSLKNNLEVILSNVKQKRGLINNICKFFRDIEDVAMIGNKIVVQKENLDTLLNLRLMGSGFQKILSIILSISRGRKYILIDELENGLHFKHIDLLLEFLLDTSDAQFFITTHNEEILRRLNEVLQHKKVENSISLFNVYRDKHKHIKAASYEQENFMFHIENDNEMRD